MARTSRPVPLAAILLSGALALLVSSCSSSGPSPAATTAPSAGSEAPPSSSTPSGPLPVYEVRTGTVPGLGTVLVDGQGFTLYLFVPDHQSGQSVCTANCARGWPPLILPSGVATPVAGAGVNSSLLGTTTRTDGSVQITYDKWPLYTWVGDSEPGQATGQGLNNLGGLWYVLSPSGQEVTAKVTS